MIMVCKNICERHKVVVKPGKPKYVDGIKRCNECGVNMNWQYNNCPCCHIKLRTRTHGNLSEHMKLVKEQSIKRIG